jgi:mono/diheme cytochrome c family protein
LRNFAYGFVAAVLALTLGSIAYFACGFAQVRADQKPSALEKIILGSAVRASVRRAAAKIPPAPSASEDSLLAGGKLYVAGCAGCHGALAGPYREDRSLFPPAPQLPHVGTQYAEPELYWIVKHGICMTGMSAYGRFYSEKQLWALATFLHRINNLPPEVLENLRPKKVG